MKRRIALCILAVCLLAGCAATKAPEDLQVSCQDIVFTLPGDFLNLSGEAYASDTEFMYGRGTLVFTGMAEQKASLIEMDLQQYTGYVISTNSVQATAEKSGDGYRFTYEKQVGDALYAYVVQTFEGPANFWIFQFYCPKENLQENLPYINVISDALRAA
jgi:hypothetical protein